MAANDTAVDGAVDGAGNRPQIYLISPPDFTLETFSGQLARVLDQVETACVRLALAGSDEDRIGRACDALRQIAHERDVALVIENHIRLAERHGLDGVHLSDGARHVRLARKELGGDAIVGAFSGRSRHDGLTAGEAGADAQAKRATEDAGGARRRAQVGQVGDAGPEAAQAEAVGSAAFGRRPKRHPQTIGGNATYGQPMPAAI